MQVIAVNWHIFQLLQGTSYTVSLLGQEITLNADALGLGGLGLARVVPVVLFALVGGMLADVRDRRKMLIATNGAAALLSALLAVLTLRDQVTVWAIYLITGGFAALNAFRQPAQQSIIPNLVPAKHLTNAVSLNTLVWQIGTIVGPALGGVLIAAQDVSLVYALDAVSFLALVGSLLMMHYRGRPSGRPGGLGRQSLVEGWRFVRGSRIIWSTMLLDFVATLFSSARTLLPLVAEQVLGVGARGYGLLATAQALGSVLTGGYLSLRRDIHRQGFVLLSSVAVYGLATALFGISTNFALSYLLFALTGAGDTVSTVIRNTLRQIKTPDRLRGRMTGINMIFFMGGPQLGELEAGIVAALFGVPFAIFSGGVATVLFTGWIAWRYPRLRNYTNASADL